MSHPMSASSAVPAVGAAVPLLKSSDLSSNLDCDPTLPEETWYHAPALPGQGPVPTWFQQEKYKTVADQAKAYPELAKKLGSFKGAPEQYELNYPEDYPENLKIDSKDPLFQYWSKVAKRHGMDNELFNQLFLSANLSDHTKVANFRKAEMAKLGPSAEQRIEALLQWAQNNLDEEELLALKESLQTARGFALIEKLVGRQGEKGVPNLLGSRMAVDQSLLDKRVADPRYRKDPRFREDTRRMFEQLYGN